MADPRSLPPLSVAQAKRRIRDWGDQPFFSSDTSQWVRLGVAATASLLFIALFRRHSLGRFLARIATSPGLIATVIPVVRSLTAEAKR